MSGYRRQTETGTLRSTTPTVMVVYKTTRSPEESPQDRPSVEVEVCVGTRRSPNHRHPYTPVLDRGLVGRSKQKSHRPCQLVVSTNSRTLPSNIRTPIGFVLRPHLLGNMGLGRTSEPGRIIDPERTVPRQCV